MSEQEIVRCVELDDLLQDESLDEEHLRELIFD